MNRETIQSDADVTPTFYVDEAGDGVLFGPKGRDRLQDPDSQKFFMLGMVRCTCDEMVARELNRLRVELSASPLYASIPSMQPSEKKTARMFHAKDDHPEIRAKVFELLIGLDFKFFAIIKDMRAVRRYVDARNRMHVDYRYKPDELYDLTVRMLFKQQLHTHARYGITAGGVGKDASSFSGGTEEESRTGDYYSTGLSVGSTLLAGG
jgi:hypothetical protein